MDKPYPYHHELMDTIQVLKAKVIALEESVKMLLHENEILRKAARGPGRLPDHEF